MPLVKLVVTEMVIQDLREQYGCLVLGLVEDQWVWLVVVADQGVGPGKNENHQTHHLHRQKYSMNLNYEHLYCTQCVHCRCVYVLVV